MSASLTGRPAAPNNSREIIKNNLLLEQAKEMLMLARQELHSAQYATYKSTQIKNTAVSVKNEVMEMIAKVRERKGRLDLPIVSGKHLRKISDRTALQSADNAEKFITTRKIDSFESLAKFTADREQKYSQLETAHLSKGQKLNRLKITPKQWKVEIQSLQSEYDSIGREQTKTATELAYAEVISYNKKNLERASEREPTAQQATKQTKTEGGRNIMNI